MLLLKRLFDNRLTLVTGLILAVIFLCVILAPYITPYDPNKGSILSRFKWPSSKHWLGTDHIGRDLFSRILYGGRVSLIVGAGAMFFGLGIGVLLGMLSAYGGSLVDNIIMRVIDLLMSFPFMLLAITMVTILGFGTKNVVIAIGIANTPGFARLTRGQVLGIMENEYIIAARSIGAPHYIILTRYILLNCVSPILIYGTLQLGRAILTEAALSYIGLGVQPPNPSWGILVSEGQNYLNSYPYLALIPGFMIMVTVFCVNIIGDRLRDVLDPKRTRLK